MSAALNRWWMKRFDTVSFKPEIRKPYTLDFEVFSSVDTATIGFPGKSCPKLKYNIWSMKIIVHYSSKIIYDVGRRTRLKYQYA